MTKFGYYTDPHLNGKGINSRLDDYPKTILGKLKEIYKVAETKNCEFMICGGDILDTWKIYSYDVILELIQIFTKSSIPTYFIIGNHDMYAGNIQTYPTTTLHFISEISNLLNTNKLIPIIEPIELDECILYGCHTFDKPIEFVNKIEKNDKFQIAISHHLIHDKETHFDVISSKSFKNANIDLLLTGDLHSGYELHKRNNISFYNPGALARTSTHSKNRKVKMGMFTIDNNIFELEEYFPTQMDGDKVFKDDADTKEFYEIELDADEFIENFDEMKKASIDIFQLLQLAKGHYEIKSELMDYINKFRQTD